MKKRVLLLTLLALVVMAPTTGGGPGGSPQTDCDDAVNSKVLYDITTGLWSCGADQGGGGGGDNISVNGLSVTDANFIDGDIDFTRDTGPAPDTIAATVACTGCVDSTDVAGLDTADITTGAFVDARVDGSLEADEVNPTLGTQTQGNFVASVATTGPLSGGAAGSEGAAISLTTSMTSSRLIGRTTAGPGVMEEITVGAPLTFSGLALDISAIADADLASSYSGVGACGANTWASTLNDNAAPTCTQPAFSNLSGSATIAQGGTTETASTEDAVLVGASTTDWEPKVIPDCDADNQTLAYDQTTNAFSCGDDDTTAAAGMLLLTVNGGITCFAGTDYLGIGSNTASCAATEGNVDFAHVGPTMTAGNLKCVKHSADATCDGVVTLRKNGGDSTASTCSFANTTSCAASTATASIASGDTWALKLVDTNCTATTISCTFTGTW